MSDKLLQQPRVGGCDREGVQGKVRVPNALWPRALSSVNGDTEWPLVIEVLQCVHCVSVN